MLRYVAHDVAKLPAPARVCEFGSYNVNGSVRGLFVGEYIGVDLRAGDGVDVVADAATFTCEPVDVVVCTSLLEHCPYPGEVVANAERILRPGGVLILTAPNTDWQPHGVDGEGVGEEFYQGIAYDDLAQWLGAFGHFGIDYSGERQWFAVGIKSG